MSAFAVTGRYPTTRPRRLRAKPWLRRLVAETAVTPADLVWPLFVADGRDQQQEIPSMAGVHRLSVDRLPAAVAEAKSLDIPAVALFPHVAPENKSADGREATRPDNLICQAIKAIKDAEPAIGVIVDVALDPYTTHGHDGLLRNGTVLNDQTVDVLVRQALVQADAGADVIAPSDMMDGRVAAIRSALDGSGYTDVSILSYAAKYASAFYGPFRDAVGSGTVLQGDKKTYQMNPANGDEALREVAMDIEEGADMVMVKPGLPYLDIVRRVKEAFAMPTFAYHVSGEYAMLRAAGDRGWLDFDRALLEVLAGFKRAGCDGVLTYAAPHAARMLAA